MEPIYFANQAQLRQWFETNHKQLSELWVGYYKKKSGLPSISWPQSVDEALCFGWIDGIRKSIDKDRFVIRFTPRNPKSNWSNVNVKKVEILTKQGLMKPSGINAFKNKEDEKSGIYSYENEPVTLDGPFENQFRSNKKAWAYFSSQSPSYQKIAARWVMSPKQTATRLSHLITLINDSEQNMKIKPLRLSLKK